MFRRGFPLQPLLSFCILLWEASVYVHACACVCVLIQIRSVKVFYIILPGAEILRVGFSLF